MKTIPTVRVFPDGSRNGFVGLTVYNCRKFNVKIGSIVDTTKLTGSGYIYEPAKSGGYDSTGIFVYCKPTLAEID